MKADPNDDFGAGRGGDPALADAAAAWVARRDAGFSAEEQTEFESWLAADPRHRRAFAEHGQAWSRLDRPARNGAASAVLAELHGLDRRRTRRRVLTGALAALLMGGFSIWTMSREHGNRGLEMATPTARVLRPERQTLPDGSIVELKDGAEIAVNFTPERRGVTLRRGEAHFQVAKNPARPFVVEANGVEFRAVGTAFAVQLGAKEVDLVVTEGHVAVDARPVAPASGVPERPAQAILSPGQQARIDAGSVAAKVRTLAASELAERLAWRAPRLEFSGTPLVEVVALLNRQAATAKGGHFSIGDDAIAQVRVSGLFRADNTAALLELLDSAFGISADRAGPTEIVLHRAHAGR